MRTLTDPRALGVKAGVGVALAFSIVQIFGLQDSLSATFVALVCTSPAVVTGMRRGAEQLVASVAGGLVTSLLLEFLPRHPLTLGIAMALTVAMAFAARLGQAYIVAGFTVLYVYILPASSPERALEVRLLSLTIGVVSATVVNLAASALLAERVYLRRAQIVRRAVVDAIAAVGRDAQGTVEHEVAARHFDGVFPLVWALGAELTDAQAELRLRTIAHEHVLALTEEAEALARVAHFAKGLAMHLDVADRKAIGEACGALEAELAGAPSHYEPPPSEWNGLYRRASEAAREACAFSVASRTSP